MKKQNLMCVIMAVLLLGVMLVMTNGCVWRSVANDDGTESEVLAPNEKPDELIEKGGGAVEKYGPSAAGILTAINPALGYAASLILGLTTAGIQGYRKWKKPLEAEKQEHQRTRTVYVDQKKVLTRRESQIEDMEKYTAKLTQEKRAIIQNRNKIALGAIAVSDQLETHVKPTKIWEKIGPELRKARKNGAILPDEVRLDITDQVAGNVVTGTKSATSIY